MPPAEIESSETTPRTTLQHAKRVVIAIIGGTVVLFGVLLIVLPGPAFVVIPAGLAILAIEFEWSRRWLARLRVWIENGKSRMSRAAAKKPEDPI